MHMKERCKFHFVPPIKLEGLPAEKWQGNFTTERRDSDVLVRVVWSGIDCNVGSDTYELWAKVWLVVSLEKVAK